MFACLHTSRPSRRQEEGAVGVVVAVAVAVAEPMVGAVLLLVPLAAPAGRPLGGSGRRTGQDRYMYIQHTA